MGTASVHGIDFRACVDKARNVLEAEVGRKLDTEVSIQAMRMSEMSSVESFIPSHVVYGAFSSKENKVFLDPNRIRQYALGKAQTNKESERVITCIVLHELIHAYQWSVLQQMDAKIRDNRVFLLFVCEGHAQHFMKKLSKHLGLTQDDVEKFFPRPTLREAWRFADNQKIVSTFFYYEVSESRSAESCEKITDFARYVGGTWTFPRALGLKVNAKSSIDKSNVLASGDPCKGVASAEDISPPLPASYLDFISYLAPGRLLDEKLIKNYISGESRPCKWDDGVMGESAVLSFTTKESAQYAFNCSLEYLKRNPRVSEMKKPESINNAGVLFSGYPDRSQAIWLHYEGTHLHSTVVPLDSVHVLNFDD